MILCWFQVIHPHLNIRISSGRKPRKIGIQLQYPNDFYERQGIIAMNRIKQTQSKNSNYNGSYGNFSVLYTYLLNNYPEIIDI